MSTNTAHFLIGQPHIVHDGIQPNQQLVLTENSRPGLFLADLPSPGFNDGEQYRHIVTWIPTVQHMMKDILLMVGLHSARLPELVALAKRSAPELLRERAELEGCDPKALEKLRETMMVADGYPKVAAMILEESHLNNQLGDLLDHPCPKEICVSDGSRNQIDPFRYTITQS